MYSSTSPIPAILFPYSSLTTEEKKRLFLLLPKTFLLRVIRPSGDMKPFNFSVEYLTPFEDSEFVKKLQKAISEDRIVAQNVSNGEGLVALEQLFEEEIAESAPFHLVTRIRGRFKKYDQRDKDRWTNAYFYQLATELEEQGIELQEKFLHVKSLENEFKSVLGIEEEERFSLLEGNYGGFVRFWEYRNSNLKRRMMSWCYLVSEAGIEDFVPIIVSKSVWDEVEEFISNTEKFHSHPIEKRVFSWQIPDLSGLEQEHLVALREESEKQIEDIYSLITRKEYGIEDSFAVYLEELGERIKSLISGESLPLMRVSLAVFNLSLQAFLRGLVSGHTKKVMDSGNGRSIFISVYSENRN